MSDFAFLDAPAPPRRTREQIYADIARENLKHRLKLIADDTERATDICRDMIAEGLDVTEELKELQITANGLMLVALMLKREASNG